MVLIKNAKNQNFWVPELLTFVLFFFQNSGVASQLQIFFSDFANGILLIKGLQKNKQSTEIQIHAG